MYPADLQYVVRAVPAHKRTTLRKLASETEVPKSTLYDTLRQGSIVSRRSTLRSLRNVKNKLDGMRFALSFVRHVSDKNEYILD